MAFVILHLESEPRGIHTAVYCDRQSGARIASRLLEMPEADVTADDILSVLGEVMNVVAGRVQGALAAEGCPSRDLTFYFASATGDLRFQLFLTLMKADGRRSAVS